MSDGSEQVAIPKAIEANAGITGAALLAYGSEQFNKYKLAPSADKDGDSGHIDITDPYKAAVQGTQGGKGFSGSDGSASIKPGVVMKGETPTIKLPDQPDQAKQPPEKQMPETKAIPESQFSVSKGTPEQHIGETQPARPTSKNGDKGLEYLPNKQGGGF